MGKECHARSITRPDTICFEGNGIRPSHYGIGWCESEIMYTLNATEVHCVFTTATPSGRLKAEDSDGWDMSDIEQSNGNRGGNVPLVLEIDEATDSFRIESEPCNDNG